MIPRERTPHLTAEEEIDLAHRARSGDGSARDRLIEANIGLALSIARDEARSCPWLDEDLEGEAMVGLMTGVDKFDPARGCRLSTVASWWIWQAVRRYRGRHAYPITIPNGLVDGSDASKNPALTEQARRVRSAGYDRTAGTAGRLVAPSETPAEAVLRREADRHLAATLADLADGSILRDSYGLGGATPQKDREIAEQLGVTLFMARGRRLRAEAELRQRLGGREAIV